ncbi:MAG TPA: transglycosylase family protein [Actinomycetota bacterium]|nr:transglycosylase family protein [Actinomycetota bacterium]
MNGSMFARRARRVEKIRRRFKRLVVGVWIATVLGAVAGIPFADAGIEIAARLTSARTVVSLAGVDTTESATSAMHFRTTVFKNRPTPEPSPTAEPAPPAPTSIAGIIYAAAAEFGIDGGYLLSIASCESGLYTQAHNPAGYYGLFQFDQSTWSAYGYGSIYDPTAQARTAARLLAAGQASRWPNCA